MAIGFGPTLGTGITDILTYPIIGNVPTQMSLSVWANRNGVGANDVGPGVIVNFGTPGTGTHRVRLQYQSTTAWRIRVAYSTTYGAYNFPVSGTGSWKHILLTIDGENAPVVYVDGVSQTVTTTTAPAGTREYGTASELQVGNWGSGTLNWDGMIAEVAYWGAILDAADAVALSKGVSPYLVRYPNIWFYSPMVRNANSPWHAGTLTGGAVQPHPRIARAQTGRSIYVPSSAPSISGFTPSPPFSVNQAGIVLNGVNFGT